MNKINALRRAINSGHYEINAYRLAIKIVQQESKLFGL
ncbi:MAG: flagellar biosynthesis anti-sigma factor FlgM [Candidatus Competibacteraceae bacterium]|nr:flagellar biosynthesis anti-sigma factor FlgM [Candidatus Competibacteraceae bacterium]MCB1811003.1 flagellar biosynthesis anti-sigma factor FlgM [Candidatus Competibacteraceae bacterium]